MQKNATKKSKRKRCLWSKAVLHYCFIFLLTFIFSLQQFSAFANTHRVGFFSRENIGKIQSLHLFISAQVAPDRPFKEGSMEPDAELAEEVETKVSIYKYWNQFAEKQLSGELFYTTFLRNQFLQIISSIQNRSSVPIFILNRSWKSFLS